MILLKEDEVKKFELEENAVAFFKTQEAEQIYQSCYTNELQAFPIDMGPILAENLRIEKNMPVSSESIIEVMNASKMGLNVPGETKYSAYPLSITGYMTLLQRAGFGAAPILTALKAKKGADEMPAELKATCINHGLKCHTNKALLLIRDEKIRAVLSEEYSVMSIMKLIEVLDEELPIYGGTFKEATASHLSSSVTYELNDKPLRQELSDVLKKADGLPYLRLITSDVGLSGANIFLGIHAKNGTEYPLGLPIRLIHKAVDIMEFKKNVNSIAAHFRDIAEKINEMATKKVYYPAGMLSAIGKKIGLLKKEVLITADIVKNTYVSAYQLDIYYELVDLISKIANQEKYSSDKIFALEESLCRIVFAGMGEYDYPYSWE